MEMPCPGTADVSAKSWVLPMLVGETPGIISARSRKFRPFSGNPSMRGADRTPSTALVTTPVHGRETVLNAALRIRSDVPFACAGGVCGTCRAKLTGGTVEMEENYALEPEELEAGYILTCQARPTSQAVTVTYDY